MFFEILAGHYREGGRLFLVIWFRVEECEGGCSLGVGVIRVSSHGQSEECSFSMFSFLSHDVMLSIRPSIHHVCLVLRIMYRFIHDYKYLTQRISLHTKM